MAKAKNKMRADGRLQAKVYIGNFDGKAKYKYAYAKTQKELDEKVFEIKLSLRKGIDITSGNDKFGYWAEQWIKLKKMEVSAGRLTSYKTSPTGIMMSTKTWNRKWHDYIIKLDHKYGDFSANISKSKFKSEKEQLSINYFTAHCLRHTFITMMYMAGIDVLTAAILQNE